MEFGLGLVTQFESNRDLSGVAAELTEQARIAAAGGIDTVLVGEHHVTDQPYLLNEPVLAHVAGHAGEATVATGVCLLPYHNPVRIAEYGATMDVLTGGRFELGVAQGYRQAEYDVFGVTREAAVGRLVEGLEIIERLWAGESVDYDGEHFRLEGVSIDPTPVQEPRPRIVMGASNEPAIRRAARLADGWWGAHPPFDVLADQIDAYREERERAGLDPGHVRVSRECYVAENRAAALDVVREPLLRKYGSYSAWGQDDVIDEDEFQERWADLETDRFIVGSPGDVVDGIERYRDELGVDGFATRMRFPGMDYADVRASLERYCEEVLPAFR